MTPKNSGRTSRAATFTSVIVAIAALRLGQEVLMPFALAVLLSFLLAPLVIFLQRHVGRIIAVVSVTLVTFVFVVAIGWFVVGQIGELGSKLPERKQHIISKIKSLRESVRGRLGRATQAVEEITEELAQETPPDSPDGHTIPEVKVVQTAESANPPPGESLWPWVSSVMDPLAVAAVVIVFVIFILMYYDDLRDRILRLMGTGRLNETTQAIDDAAGRVSRYLLMQTVINVSHGVAVATGLYFLGLPSALFFGLTSALLRFIPYLGPVAAAMPIGLALAVFDGWTSPFLVIAFFILLEIVSNNVLEPWLYGSSTGLSPMAVIVAAVFWSWLWGPIGLVLSAPLTVCLVVLGKHVTQLHFLNILLSDQEVLEPKVRLYQRLLVMDQDGSLEVAEKYLEEHSLEETYDQVLLPALAMSEIDRHHGDQDDVRGKFISEHMRYLIEELSEAGRQAELKKARTPGLDAPSAVADAPSRTSVNILCLPARDEADELAGIMFADILSRDGHTARCISVSALAGEMMDVVEKEEVQIVCVSALPPSGVTHARYLYKRLRSRFERLEIVVGLWTTTADPLKALKRTTQDDSLNAVTSLASGRELVNRLTQSLVLSPPSNDADGHSTKM